MLTSGRVVFTDMEEVDYGKPAAEAVAEIVKAGGAERVFLMVSGTLNRETDEVEKLRRALGNKCVGTFDKMPAHTPRTAVIAAANRRARPGRLIVTLGGGSITDGAKAVQLSPRQRHHHRRGPEIARRHVKRRRCARSRSRPRCRPANSRYRRRHQRATKVKELFRYPLTIPQPSSSIPT